MENKEGRFYKTYMKMKRKICGILAAVILVSAPIASYQEAEAASLAIVGGMALGDILLDLLIGAGCVGIGYLGAKALTSAQQSSLKSAVASDETVASALGDAEEWEAENELTVIDGNLSYSSSSGFNFNGKNNGDSSIYLSPELIAASCVAVKQWVDNNVSTVAEAADEAGTVETDYDYLTSYSTEVKTVTNIATMSDLDDFFAIDGCADFLSGHGYSDDEYYFMIYDSGSILYIMPIPLVYSVVGYHLAWLDSTSVFILSNSNYKNSIVRKANLDASSFYSYFHSLSTYTGRYFSYSYSSDEWTEVDDTNYLPSYKVLSGSSSSTGWFMCNFSAAYANGVFIGYTYYGSSEISRIYWSGETTAAPISYDTSLGASYEDGLTYEIPSSDYEGFSAADFDSLIEYITSLSADLAEWQETATANQEEIIEQNETIIEQNSNILEGMNKLTSYTATISSNIAKIYTTLSNILTQVKALPDAIGDSVAEAMTDILSDGLELGGINIDELNETIAGLPDALADAIADSLEEGGIKIDELEDAIIALPDAIAEAIPEALPEIDPIPDDVIEAIVTLPETLPEAIEQLDINVEVNPIIEIPEITIPDIVIPTPEITLNPNYEITVENDYSGLENPVANAINTALCSLFIPDTDLTLERVGTIQSYFGFVDDIKGIVSDFQTSVFGITPSPYLKIPIGSPTSDYNYGLGSYITIDISWYADYKEYGDKLILALVWGLFLWKLFVLLPGIINGTSGFFSDKPESHGLDLTVSGGIDNLPLLEDKHR